MEYSRRNLDFLLKEVFQVQNLTQHSYFQDYTPEMFDMVLDTMEDIAAKTLRPAFVEADKKEPELVNGKVSVHPKVGDYLKAMGEGGLISAPFSIEHGGQQLPMTVNAAGEFIRGAANNSIIMFTGLTAGAAHLITTFGTPQLVAEYTQKMFDGKWTGTMCLTEPQAGSSLSDVQTTASPQADGTYKIKGQKVFISGGDHDMVDNIVHLVLARIDGAPLGTKGISLFVVPKYLNDGQGNYTIDNDVISTGIYHKMGQKACPAMHLTFGDANKSIGYIVGEPHQGLKYMFQMMNEARLGVGLGGAYIASAAYYASLQYAKERPQGRKLNDKNLKEEQTFIINHPDVKRMLMNQKSLFEGATSLIFECYNWQDLIHAHGADSEEGKRYQTLLDLMTTVAKTIPAETGIRSVNDGIQVFGGYGYTRDFPLEQMARDIRIMSIYEGTTGIHALNLLGRGIVGNGGAAPQLLFQEVIGTITEAKKYDETRLYAEKLEKELGRLQKVTMHLVELAMKGDNEVFLADATLYMDLFGTICVAWQWLKQGLSAQLALLTQNNNINDTAFYESKIHTMKFYYHYELTKTLGLAARLLDTELLTVGANEELVL